MIDADGYEWPSKEDFEANIRTTSVGPCTLDVTEKNILSYPSMSLDLLIDNIKTTVPLHVSTEVLAVCERHGLTDNFTIRHELVNFKKVCLNLYKEGQSIAIELRKLTAFFYCSVIGVVDENTERYTELCETLMKCRGVIEALHDTRRFTKALCCVPRHPRTKRCKELRQLSLSLSLQKKIAAVEKFFIDFKLEDLVKTYQPRLDTGGYMNQVSQQFHAENSRKRILEWLAYRRCIEKTQLKGTTSAESCSSILTPLQSNDGKSRRLLNVMHELMIHGRARGWPEYVFNHLQNILIARGGSKVFELHDELALYCTEVQKPLARLRRCHHMLMSMELSEKTSAGINRYKRLHLTTGCVDVTDDLLQWTEKVLHVPDRKLFGASDTNSSFAETMFIPSGFMVTKWFANFRAIISKHQPLMRDIIKTYGWPPVLPDDAVGTKPTFEFHGIHKCKMCSQSYSNLWVQRGLCHECEATKRGLGVCPWSAGCAKKRSFCPHDSQCFVCDQWSCSKCQLLRGDGEDVAAMVENFRPYVVCLDFDRTVASTKGGANPLQGSHTVDPTLLLLRHPNVHIVTRNSHKEQIKEFLAREGFVVQGIHSVKQENRSKADAIFELLPEGKQAIFVDDDIKELCDPRLEHPRICRVLFVRGLS
eukprot:m.175417 g.175417  ORF g.175417 m.175417 type:complete len:648 (+) comp31818_c0_seq1:216-2159(+)